MSDILSQSQMYVASTTRGRLNIKVSSDQYRIRIIKVRRSHDQPS